MRILDPADLQSIPDGASVEADLTWKDGAFRPGIRLAVDQGRFSEIEEWPDDEGTEFRLRGLALLPGFVNAHSHAFQRALRGLGETFPAGSGSFWTWREAMYGLVEDLDADRVLRISRAAFREMRAAGITTVGEFHYVRHADPDARDHAFDEAVIAAALEAGIRLVLMPAHYRHGGFEDGGPQPLAGGQRRFDTVDSATYWKRFDELAAMAAGAASADRITLGAVAHSVRAVLPEEIAEMVAEARRRDLTFHLHLEEQRREIEDARAAWGKTPMAALLERIEDFSGVTAVHCTHSDPEELAEFLARGGRVCLCPLTEANLGDGFAAVEAMVSAPAPVEVKDHEPVCLGTDSNARISMIEEMRWTELGQRAAGERRGVLRDPGGETARSVLRLATTGGAAALGLEAGKIEAGAFADLVAIDLDAPELAGATPETLLPALVYGAGNRVILGTWVSGSWAASRYQPQL